MDRLDPRIVFDALHGHPVPEDAVEFSAEYLFLQRLAFSGKAVGVRAGRWNSPGFNTSSAYGLPGTERFGHVLPMIPSLIRTIESYTSLVVPERLLSFHTVAPLPNGNYSDLTIVYIDPPYKGSTPYPDGDLSRDDVVSLACAWAKHGAHVLVSEGEAIDKLVSNEWMAIPISNAKEDTSPFRGKQEEWLTVSPSVREVMKK